MKIFSEKWRFLVKNEDFGWQISLIDVKTRQANRGLHYSRTSAYRNGCNLATVETRVERCFQDHQSFRTPSLTRAVRPSPKDTVDLTPEGVRRHFLKLREVMNDYVQEERSNGVTVRLDYNKEPKIIFFTLISSLWFNDLLFYSHFAI